MMTTGDSQITSSLTVVVLDEEVGTMAHEELHTPEHKRAVYGVSLCGKHS